MYVAMAFLVAARACPCVCVCGGGYLLCMSVCTVVGPVANPICPVEDGLHCITVHTQNN